MKNSKYQLLLGEYLEAADYAKSTINSYTSLLGVFLSRFNTDHPTKINSQQIIQFIGEQKCTSTKKQYRGVIKHFYDMLGQPKKLKFVPYPKGEKKLPKVMSRDEVNERLSKIQNLKHKSICALLYGCGLRVSEVINLKCNHILSDQKKIFIQGAKGKKDRYVGLPDDLLELLREYYLQFKTDKPNGFLFNGQFKPKYSSGSIRNIVWKYFGTNPHNLRHCFATHLVEEDISLPKISKLLGHGSIKTTQIYTHVANSAHKVQSPLSIL